jgi:hypothetical protein
MAIDEISQGCDHVGRSRHRGDFAEWQLNGAQPPFESEGPMRSGNPSFSAAGHSTVNDPQP